MAGYTLPLTYEFTVYTGTSFEREFRWLDDSSTPIDLSGWTANMLIGQQLAEADMQLNISNGGITLTDQGQIIITMSPIQTGLLKPPVAFYNLDLIEPSGFIRRFMRGRLSVVVDVKPRTP
jgi:hypothetical protein